MKYIYLMTKNTGKIATAAQIFNKKGIEVRPLDFEVQEIQADSSIEIAKHAAIQAYEKFKEPVMREDHSFFIDELGIPGPYMSYIERRVDLDALRKIISSLKSNDCHFELAAAYVDSKGKVHEFVYTVPVVIDSEARGDEKQRWNRMIRFPDKDKRFAEYGPNEDVDIWGKNYEKIAELINAGIFA